MVVMDRDWQVKLSIALLACMTFACVTAVSLAAWWTWGPDGQPFAYIEPGNDSAEVANGTIVLRRTLKVDRKVELSVTRDLVRYDGQQMLRIRLPESRAVYEPGLYRIVRPLELPVGVPPGTYQMDNVVRWTVNPMRTGHVRLPPVQVVIP